MRSKTSVLLALALGLALCLVAISPASARGWNAGTRLCTHNNPAITETSGLSRSTYKRKVLFLHNDSGDSARFFAVSRKCNTRAVITVRGVTARDWEDMAPGPDHTLWFGDIGDNGSTRESISVVRVKEPKKLPKDRPTRSVKGTSYELVYPDGAHNAEAMMIRPKSGWLYIITKSPTAGAIYRAPAVLDPNNPNVLTKIADAPTGLSRADFARTGGRFVLGGYKSVFIYDKMGAEPTRVPVPAGHTFGEALTWTRNGQAIILGGEGAGTSLWKLKEV